MACSKFPSASLELLITIEPELFASVLAESVYVLTKIYRVPKERVAASLKDLLVYRGIANEDREALIEALTVFAERSLDIVDCLLYAKSRQMRATCFRSTPP